MEKEFSQEELTKFYANLISKIQNEDTLEKEINKSNEILLNLLNVEKNIRMLSLFSPNETYEDINDENLIFIDLPYQIALTCQKIQKNRLKYLDECEKYNFIFINLLKHYEILPKIVNKVLEEKNQNKNFQISREDKIKLYKEEKLLKDEINKEKNKTTRKFYQIRLQIKSIKAMNNMLFLPQERQILEFKLKLDKNPELKAQYEKERQNYQPPQMSFVKLDKEAREPNQIIQQYLKQRGIEPKEQKKEDMLMNPNISNIVKQFPITQKLNQREQMKEDLLKPSFLQPTMTLEEHTDLEYTLMMNKQEKAKLFGEAKKKHLEKMGITDENDSDNEMVSDINTFKAREWDNWKDENEKGGGNRNR